VNIQSTILFVSSGKGGSEVPITVMLSRTVAAIFGIARTILHPPNEGAVPSGYTISLN
jgi:hypothetical protein